MELTSTQIPQQISERFFGFMKMKPGLFHRKKWTAYAYIDLPVSHNEASRIFFHNRIPFYPMKLFRLASTDKFRLYISRVHKEDAELFEACLFQLHTILSKEAGYELAKEELLGVIDCVL